MNEGSVRSDDDIPEPGTEPSTGDARLDALFDQLESVMTQTVASDLGALVRLDGPSAGLLAAGARFERIRRQAAAFDTAYVAALETGNEPARHGCATTAVFLAKQLRLSPGAARARVSASHACSAREEFAAGVLPPARPVLAAARAAGLVSDEHTSIILAALDKLPDRTAPEDVEAAEERLVSDAIVFGPGTVAGLGRRILDHIDPDGTLRDDTWKQRIRCATLIRNADGTGTLKARLTPEALEVWQTILDPLAKPLPTGPGGPDPRSSDQRLHDGLLDAGQRLLAGGDLPASGGTPTSVVIHVTQDQYAAQLALARPSGLAETEHGNLLPLGSAFKLADQAAVCTVLTDSKDVPLQLGRTTRIATPGQTIALAARDRGCTFPGCTRPAAWTQRHHIIAWQHGGLTNLANLALLCGYHHRTYEAQGWRCVMKDGRPHWVPPAWIDPHQHPIRNHYFDQDLIRPGP